MERQSVRTAALSAWQWVRDGDQYCVMACIWENGTLVEAHIVAKYDTYEAMKDELNGLREREG